MHTHKSDLNMKIDTVENALFSITINPLLGFLISCSNKECQRAGELDKIMGLAKQLDVRFMHFNYIPTERAKAYVELDLTPDQRLQALETIGKEIIGLYLLAKEEELKYGKSNVKVAKFFSTCPQYASVTKELSQKQGEKFMVQVHYTAKKGVENVANFLGGCRARAYTYFNDVKAPDIGCIYNKPLWEKMVE